MTTLVGKGRVPLMVMYGVLAVSIPPLVIADASMAVVFAFGLLVTVTCCGVGVLRIIR